jgi:cobalamin biosynthesis protein CbiD
MRFDVLSETGQDLDDIFEGIHVHADVERNEIHPAVFVPSESAQIGVGIKRETGVRVPDE